MNPILVTGATGNIGQRVVHELRAMGASTRVFARDPDKARRLFGNDLDLAQGDYAKSALDPDCR